MRLFLKVGVVLLPVLSALVLIRACSSGEAERFRSWVAEVDPAAQVTWDADGLIVIAPDRAWGAEAGASVIAYRAALVENYSDLLGTGRDERMVVVLFSNMESLQAYFDSQDPFPRGPTAHPQGWTDPSEGAIYLPPESGFQTLKHETVHLLMGQARTQSVSHSPWLKEGLAQLFEVYEPDADPPQPPGLGSNDRVALINMLIGADIDVMRLLEIDHYEDFVSHDVRRNYLEALALTAFLFEQRPREKLAEYIDLERRAAGPLARLRGFERIYDFSGEAFRADLRAYLTEHSRR